MGSEEKKKEKIGKNPLLEKLKAIDVRLTNKFALAASDHSPLGHYRSHLKMLELSCHGIPWLAGCTIFLFLSSERETKAFICNLYIALVVDIICVACLKALTRRQRPNINKKDMPFTIMVDKLSFPSGHVSRSVLVTSIFYHQWGLALIPLLLLHIWCVGVCLSRILLGRHHVGDVLGGVALGWVLHWVISLLWLSTPAAIALLSVFMSTESSDDSG